MLSMRTKRLTVAIALGGCLLACSDLGEFRTGEGEVFRGTVSGSETGDAGDDSSFIRNGFPSYTQMELTFDPAKADSSPGRITTRDPGSGVAGHFDRTPLQAIRPLAHDPLTEYTFPGGGRLTNYIFGARMAGEPRSALVFVSLMEEGEIEVRVIAPGAAACDGGTLDELFGVFRLKKTDVQ